MYLRDLTDNEVGGFGITEADNLLFVTDIVLVKQKVTAVSVSFDDNSVADFFDEQVELGRQPQQFARIWLHTHPGNSPEPSCTDEETFSRVFGSCDWSVMAIVAQGGKTYARLRFSAGPGGGIMIPVSVNYNCDFKAADINDWKAQYQSNVVEDNSFIRTSGRRNSVFSQLDGEDYFGCDGSEGLGLVTGEDVFDEIDSMDPTERAYFMEELSTRSEFWDEYESEVLYE